MEEASDTAYLPLPSPGTVPLQITTGTLKACTISQAIQLLKSVCRSPIQQLRQQFSIYSLVCKADFGTSATVSICYISSGLIFPPETAFISRTTENYLPLNTRNTSLCKTRQPDVQICWLSFFTQRRSHNKNKE